MTDHDDTPSTEERERARRQLISEGALDCTAAERNDWLEALTVQCNRLAARVASAEAEVERLKADDIARRNAYSELADTNERLRTELAKLRAAAAPVAGRLEAHCVSAVSPKGAWMVSYCEDGRNLWLSSEEADVIADRVNALLALPPQEDVRGALPEGWVVDECGDMLGPKGAEVYSDKGRTWIYNSDVDSACAAPTDVLRRHLLALSPQEDVRGAIADQLDAEAEKWEVAKAGALPEDAERYGHYRGALRGAARRLRDGTWPTAPRTEGGGDHGE